MAISKRDYTILYSLAAPPMQLASTRPRYDIRAVEGDRTMTRAKSSLSTDRDLYAGLIRLHVLHHASERPIYGAWIIEELGHHGYALSPGTLYPLLHGLEKKGYLRSKTIMEGRRGRRIYSITAKGCTAFVAAKDKVRELFGELFAQEHEL